MNGRRYIVGGERVRRDFFPSTSRTKIILPKSRSESSKFKTYKNSIDSFKVLISYKSRITVYS